MDVDKIFDLFDTPDEPKKQVIMGISEHPAFWIGMFRKIIMNHSNFSSTQLSVFKTAFPNMDINDIRNAGEFIIYTRSYGFLQKLDIERELDLQILKDSTSTELVVSLKLSISYFESIEDYETCVEIKELTKVI